MAIAFSLALILVSFDLVVMTGSTFEFMGTVILPFLTLSLPG